MSTHKQQVAKFIWVGSILPDLIRSSSTVKQTALKFPMRKFEPYTLKLDEGEYAYHPYPSDITIPIIGSDKLVFNRYNHTKTVMTINYINPITQEKCNFNMANYDKNIAKPIFEFNVIVIDLNKNEDQYIGDFYFFNQETDNIVAHMKFIPHGNENEQQESFWLMTKTGGVAMFDTNY